MNGNIMFSSLSITIIVTLLVLKIALFLFTKRRLAKGSAQPVLLGRAGGKLFGGGGHDGRQ
jgi:hypothetical protein